METKKNNNYVNNEVLHSEIKDYIEKLQTKPNARIPESIGKQVHMISNGLAHSSYFIRYPYKDELIFDGVFDCLKYIKNYDVTKTNPHAYFTTICKMAFFRRIAKEKKHLYTKFKIQINSGHELNLEADYNGAVGDISKGTAGDFSRIHQFVSDFENSKNFKK